MLEKGHITTPYYRWLLKSGTFIWVQSRGVVIQEKHHHVDEESFTWITYMIRYVGMIIMRPLKALALCVCVSGILFGNS